MKKKKRILGILLSFVLVLSLMPGISLTVYAEDEYESLKNTPTVVYFDNKEWYLIDFDSSTVTLLTKECVARSTYGKNNTYSGSTVEGVVNKWYEETISDKGKTAVSESRMFLLTAKQAKLIPEELRICSQFGWNAQNGLVALLAGRDYLPS